MKRFSDLPKRDQNLIQVMIIALLITLYFGAIYPFLMSNIEEQSDKIRSYNKSIASYRKDTPRVTENATVLQGEMQALNKRLEDVQTQLQALPLNLVEPRSIEALNRLRTAIVQLAQHSELEVANMFDGNELGSQRIRPSDETLAEGGIDGYYKRPLMTLEVRGSYWGLLNFVEQLPLLEYNVSVVRLTVEQQGFPESPSTQSPKLRTRMVLAL